MAADESRLRFEILSSVARHLELERSPTGTSYEAETREGHRIRILIRPSRNRNKSGFSFRPEEFGGKGDPFDYFLGVLYDEDHPSHIQIVRAPYRRLSALVAPTGRSHRIYWSGFPCNDGSIEFLEISTGASQAIRQDERVYAKTHPASREARYARQVENLIERQRQELQSAGAFHPDSVDDARERIMQAVVLRRGQSEFRERLIRDFEGKCAITGCDALDVLEAAHIVPYKGSETNHPANGLLLRADVHTLFDLGLIAIDVATMTVIVAPSLAGSCYADLAGKPLRSRRGEQGTSEAALMAHRAGSRV